MKLGGLIFVAAILVSGFSLARFSSKPAVPKTIEAAVVSASQPDPISFPENRAERQFLAGLKSDLRERVDVDAPRKLINYLEEHPDSVRELLSHVHPKNDPEVMALLKQIIFLNQDKTRNAVVTAAIELAREGEEVGLELISYLPDDASVSKSDKQLPFHEELKSPP